MLRKVLTPFQERVLTALFDHGLADREYYLTGGTTVTLWLILFVMMHPAMPRTLYTRIVSCVLPPPRL